MPLLLPLIPAGAGPVAVRAIIWIISNPLPRQLAIESATRSIVSCTSKSLRQRPAGPRSKSSLPNSHLEASLAKAPNTISNHLRDRPPETAEEIVNRRRIRPRVVIVATLVQLAVASRWPLHDDDLSASETGTADSRSQVTGGGLTPRPSWLYLSSTLDILALDHMVGRILAFKVVCDDLNPIHAVVLRMVQWFAHVIAKPSVTDAERGSEKVML